VNRRLGGEQLLHDSSLTELAVDGDRVRLRLVDVWIGDDNHYNAIVTLGGVGRMTRDDKLINTLRMEAEDAQVLVFERSQNTVNMIVAWISHATHTDDTHSYEFAFTTFDLQTEK
jgi:hypothetical protein